MISDFQAGKERVMLLSSKAGGLGITLTAATHVVLLDPWWHPFVEFQAIKRAHRKGQTKTVHMHRFFVQEPDSIDMWMLGLQKSKLEEAKLIMPDLVRYSDCFILEERSKVNLVAEFRNWIIQWVGDLGEETKDLIIAAKEKEKVKAKAQRESKSEGESQKARESKPEPSASGVMTRRGKRKLEELRRGRRRRRSCWRAEAEDDSWQEYEATPEEIEKFTEEMWSCSACTFDNGSSDSACKMCQTQRSVER